MLSCAGNPTNSGQWIFNPEDIFLMQKFANEIIFIQFFFRKIQKENRDRLSARHCSWSLSLAKTYLRKKKQLPF
jgi:hypothetical protein